MAHLNLDAVRSGMVLQADVTSRGGHTLLKTGTELSTRHLTLLKAYGVPTVSVRLPSAEDRAATLADPARGDCCLAERYRHNDVRHPLIRELLRLCEVRQAAASTAGAGE